jgi:hypothetical protein
MKVICLKSINTTTDKYTAKQFAKEGEIYTVINCQMIQGVPAYEFKEIPLEQEIAWGRYPVWAAAKFFAPLCTYKDKELKEELKEIFKVEIN